MSTVRPPKSVHDLSAARHLWLDAAARRWRKRGKGCAENRVLAELRHLLDSACLSFLAMLPTFTGFSHGVNQSGREKGRAFLCVECPPMRADLQRAWSEFHSRFLSFSMGHGISAHNFFPPLAPNEKTGLCPYRSRLQARQIGPLLP